MVWRILQGIWTCWPCVRNADMTSRVRATRPFKICPLILDTHGHCRYILVSPFKSPMTIQSSYIMGFDREERGGGSLFYDS